ncbi:MAG: L,D-transpeptidase family protein [Armatimonadota bacterium]
MTRSTRLLQGFIFSLVLVLLSLSVAPAQEDAAEREENALTVALRRLPFSVGENKTVTVQRGETWVDIGIREHVGYEHLRRANPGGFASGSILIPGRHQAAGLVNDGVVLNLPELTDFRWVDGRVTAWYPVSVGRVARRTPVGQLRAVNKVKNPAWRRPNGTIMPPGPRNPLGDRWIGLSKPGYGLHGTNDATSIGRTVSAGCIRHFPPHIHELFDSARVGMPVIITYETVTVGQEDGIVYLSVFPDVYGRGTNAPSRVRARLARFGLGDVLTGPGLERTLAQADGVARPILGSDTPVTVNDAPLDSPIGPTIREGESYLPLRAIMEQIGASVRWDGSTRTAIVTHGDRTASFTADGGQAFIALGAAFVPVRDLVERLGGTASYDPETGISLALPAPAREDRGLFD